MFSDFTCDSNLNKWVDYAIQRQVEHLEIYLKESRPLIICLPSSVLTCQTIVVLKLAELKVNVVNSVSLPSLKILHLNHVRIPNRGFVGKLLSGCPVLENLFLNEIIVYSHLNSWNDCYKILPKLISADVGGCFVIPWKQLQGAEFLRLRLMWSRNVIPPFPNLVHIELVMEDYMWKALVEILQNSPKVQILVIIKEKLASRYCMYCIETNFVGAKWIPSSLRKCQMEGFEGKECELQFAKYIMENATVLTSMKISSFDASKSGAKLQMLKKLSSYKRISPECQLLFE